MKAVPAVSPAPEDRGAQGAGSGHAGGDQPEQREASAKVSGTGPALGERLRVLGAWKGWVALFRVAWPGEDCVPRFPACGSCCGEGSGGGCCWELGLQMRFIKGRAWFCLQTATLSSALTSSSSAFAFPLTCGLGLVELRKAAASPTPRPCAPLPRFGAERAPPPARPRGQGRGELQGHRGGGSSVWVGHPQSQR